MFGGLITLGQVIFSIGVAAKSWSLLYLGRLVLGFGGESFTVANSALLADWFKGRELAFAFGVNLSISRLGSVLTNIVSPALTNSTGIVFAVWFGSILCAGSLLCIILAIPIDKAMDEKIAKQKSGFVAVGQEEENVLIQEKLENTTENDKISTNYDTTEAETEANPAPTVSFRDVLHMKHIFWVLMVSCIVIYGCILPFNYVSSSLLLERDYFKDAPAGCELTNNTQCESTSNPPLHCPGTFH